MDEKTQAHQSDPGVVPVLDAIVDVEDYARRGEQPPLAKGYRILVNGDPFIVEHSVVSGRVVLVIAGLIPPENFTLRLKRPGQKPEKVELDDPIDLRNHGVEKFKALPRDQTEG